MRLTDYVSSAFIPVTASTMPPMRAQDYFMGKKQKKKGRPTFIKAWRKFRGLTQEQLAERIDLGQPTVARIERGDIAYTQPVLEAIAEALRCEPADLIMRDPGKQSIWSIWDQIEPQKREVATEMLAGLVKKAG